MPKRKTNQGGVIAVSREFKSGADKDSNVEIFDDSPTPDFIKTFDAKRKNQQGSHGGVVAVCREIMIEANRASGGEIFQTFPGYNVTEENDDQIVKIVKSFLKTNGIRESEFVERFPSQFAQDSIMYVALLKSGVDYKDIKKPLKEGGFDDVLQLLGHATHSYYPQKSNTPMDTEQRILLIQSLSVL